MQVHPGALPHRLSMMLVMPPSMYFGIMHTFITLTPGLRRHLIVTGMHAPGLPKEVATEGNLINKGAKTVLFGILKAADGSLTTAQIWEQAEVTSVSSPRHCMHCHHVQPSVRLMDELRSCLPCMDRAITWACVHRRRA